MFRGIVRGNGLIGVRVRVRSRVMVGVEVGSWG